MEVILPSIFSEFDEVDEHEVSEAFMREWFWSEKASCCSKKNSHTEIVHISQYLINDDVLYVTDQQKINAMSDARVPTITKHADQTDAFATFLLEYDHAYPRVAKAIRTMLVEPSNSSAIERGYAILKEVVSPKRNCLSKEQIELCVLLANHLPNDLEDMPLMEIHAEMLKLCA